MAEVSTVQLIARTPLWRYVSFRRGGKSWLLDVTRRGTLWRWQFREHPEACHDFDMGDGYNTVITTEVLDWLDAVADHLRGRRAAPGA